MNEPKTETIWMHYSCAFWHGINYKNGVFQKFENFHYQKYIGSVCSICKQREGACVKCFGEKCEQIFHVECARRVKFEMLEIDQKPFCIIRCPEHIDLQIELKLTYLLGRNQKQLKNYKNLLKRTLLPSIQKDNSSRIRVSSPPKKKLSPDKNKVSFSNYAQWNLL